MKNRIKELRLLKQWNQDNLADAINYQTERNPKWKKVTKKNPDGLIDQQTVGRLESGDIDLTDRYLLILSEVFSVSPNDILGISTDEQFRAWQAFLEIPEKKRKALLELISET